MTKKLSSLILAVIITASSLTGCISLNINGNYDSEETEAFSGNEEYTTVAFDPEQDTEPETEPETNSPVSEVSVRPAEWTEISWQPYSCAYFTLNIPEGWKVEWNGNAQKLVWRATSPDGKIGICNIDHDYAAKDPSMTKTLGFEKSLSDASVKGYFEMIFEDTADNFTVQNSCVPANKSALQASSSKQIRDYQAHYATFKDSTVGEGEGVYSAVMVESNDIVIRGTNYGVWEFDAIFYNWAPLGQLVNWQPVIAQIAQSFTYTDYYIQEWQSVLNTTVSPSSSISDTDPVMEAFEERSKSDTIIQEKRSDMLGEYERVYDNDTGNIYRAYNGFLDDIGDQNRYQAITDNQYTEGYVGWIDKD